MMSSTETIGNLITECLNRCRESGYTLATLIRFLDELRAGGQPEVDVQRVDAVIRQILTEIRGTGESPTEDVDTVKWPREQP